MARKRGFIMVTEYFAFRIVFMIFRAMPMDTALAVARLISPIVYLLHARHRRVALDNLRHAFAQEMTEREIRRIARGVYAHLVMTGAEILKMGGILTPDNWQNYVRVENKHFVDDVIASGKGAIFVTAHFGNWELNSLMMKLLDHPLHTIARPLDNPLLDEYVNKFRADVGWRVIGKKGALRSFVRILRENKFLGMIVDQDARDQGIFVEFFGRQSSWIPSPAVLALRFNVPIICACNYRRGNRFEYTIVVDEPILPVKTGNDEEDVRRIVAEYSKRIEGHIRKHPEQWLWNHRRWKTRPPEELAKQRQEQPKLVTA